MRCVLALLVAAGIAALGALILGEYSFTGVTPYVAAVLYALVVSEVVTSLARQRGPLVALATAVLIGTGLSWALWISTGRGVAPVPTGGLVGIGLGAVAGAWRVNGWRRRPTQASVPASERRSTDE
jgi:hypothetical protein